MAFETAVGSFNTGTGTSTISVSGLSFQPKAGLVFMNGRTGTTDSNGQGGTGSGTAMVRSVGFFTSTTSRRVCVTRSLDGSASATADSGYREDSCLASNGGTNGAIDGLLDVQSINSDGVTFVPDDAFPSDFRVHYLLLGGADLTDAEIVTITEPASAGTQNVSFSFVPDCLIIISCPAGTGSPPLVAVDSRLAIGVAVRDPAADYTWSGGSNDAATTMQTVSYCWGSGESFTAIDGGVANIDSRGRVTTWGTTTVITWDERGSGVAEREYFILALKGGKYFAGDLTTATNTTAFGETGVGFQPKGGLFLSHCLAESTQNVASAHDIWSMGVVDSAENQRCMASSDEDNTANAEVATAVEHDEMYTNMGTGDAKVGGCALNSWDSDGFTLQMTDADPSAAFVWYLVFGDGALTVSPSAIGSGEAHGTQRLDLNVTPSALGSGEAFGTATVSAGAQSVEPSSVASLEAFGSDRVDLNLAASGLASGEQHGTQRLDLNVSPTAVASGEAHGSQRVDLELAPSAVASGEAHGSQTVSPGPAQVSPGGVASAEQHGSQRLDLNLTPSGVASGEQHGTQRVDLNVAPSGITSLEAFGTARLDLVLLLSSVAPAETFGTASVELGNTQNLLASAIASAEAFGSQRLDLVLTAGGLASLEQFGTQRVDLNLVAAAIASGEAFGNHAVLLVQQVSPSAVPSGETFGAPLLALVVAPSAIPTAEQVPAPTLVVELVILPSGIATLEVFGSPTVVDTTQFTLPPPAAFFSIPLPLVPFSAAPGASPRQSPNATPRSTPGRTPFNRPKS